jgi:probable rRNA maturation factor
MIRTLLFCESRYPVDRRGIKKTIEEVLGEKGVSGDVEVSVSIIGDRKMRTLNKKYRNLDKTTNVLSFSQTEGQGTASPDGVLRLGDVVLSFPQVVKGAREKETLVDDEVNFLVKHALHHLLGIHHE